MISVCIATYNGKKYIKEQLNSIVSQISEQDEIIVSDDGSSDGTLDIVKAFDDKRIKIVSNENRHGFVGNFENALIHAQGNFIFLSDQDDVWAEKKIDKMLEYLNKYDLVVHDAMLVDENGRCLNKTYYECLHRNQGFWMNFWKNRFLGCCMAMKRCVLEYSLPFPKDTLGHDYWIGMLALTKYKVCFVDDVLLYYRRHGGNVSSSSEKSKNSFFYKIFIKRLPMLFWVIRRRFFKR